MESLKRAIAAERAAIDLKETTMTDDPKKTGLDRKLISLTEDHEIRSWTESLKCSELELRKAIAAVGNSARAVREYLGERR